MSLIETNPRSAGQFRYTDQAQFQFLRFSGVEEFGTKLRVLRQNEDMTLQELADELGYESHSYLSEIESAKKKPPTQLILQVSRIFGVSTDSLLKDEISIQQLKDEAN
jgi:transcriptional regulator with XRE-family HTH domain